MLLYSRDWHNVVNQLYSNKNIYIKENTQRSNGGGVSGFVYFY